MSNFNLKLTASTTVDCSFHQAESIKGMLVRQFQAAIAQGLFDKIFEQHGTEINDFELQVHIESNFKKTQPVSATVVSDDNKAFATFDSSKWFEQASDDEIMTLACGAEWGSSEVADEIAQFFVSTNADVANVFHYLSDRTDLRKFCSYECHIDPLSALAWLKHNRPHLYRLLQDEDE